MTTENETPEVVEEEQAEGTVKPEEEPVVAEAEPEAVPEENLTTLDDVVDRATNMVNNARQQGFVAITRRFLGGLEGFLAGVSGDDKKPKG